MNLNYIKGGIFTIYERIFQETQKLQQQIDLLKEQLKELPDGKLTCCYHDNRSKWYLSNGHSRTYIPKENRRLAEQLAAKKYLTHLLNDLSHEKRALEFYLKHHDPEFGKAHQTLYELPGYLELLSPYFQPLSIELSNWMKEPFESNPAYPEHLVHKTISGHLVRSKSEAMITQFLFSHRIPFRYEAALTLGNSPIYPDFTIRHPQNGEFFYWEHFGLMDDPSYAQKAISKLSFYTSHGIIPSIQLITTYETKEAPLTAEIIQKIIEHYFL